MSTALCLEYQKYILQRSLRPKIFILLEVEFIALILCWSYCYPIFIRNYEVLEVRPAQWLYLKPSNKKS